jgi:hypothetical protein
MNRKRHNEGAFPKIQLLGNALERGFLSLERSGGSGKAFAV